MSHYINKSVFKGDGFEQEGVWALIGTPTNDLVNSISSEVRTIDGYKVNVDNTEKQISFKDAYIAGFAKVETSLNLSDIGNGNVQIVFPISTESSIFFNVNSDEQAKGILATSLAFVTLQKNTETGKSFFYSDEETDDVISLAERTSKIYNDIWGNGENELKENYTLDSTNIFTTYFDKILLVYELNLAGAATAVNMFNYTGFSVGNAIINLSGLDIIFNNYN